LGHLLLHNTPESLHEKLPVKSRCGNYVITSHARIDNRGELLKTFDVPPPEYANTPDSALILEAYRKWGEECPHHLLGDWVFAIRDAREQKLFIARDHQGATGLYYYHGPRFFAFCSGLKGLLALADIPRRLNELQVARVLTGWYEHGPSTVYEGISRLPPAHAVTITSKEVKIKRYWYLEDTPRLRFKRDEDYVGAFLEIYREAVRCRLRGAGKVGVTLSGGLDSGSVAALAAGELQKKGGSLPAFSAVPLYDIPGSLPGDRCVETPYIKATAAYVGNIDLNLIRSEHDTPLQGIEKGLEIHDEPVHAVNNQYWMFSLWAAARDRGVGTMLTGTQGNFTISWHGRGYLGQLARQMRWITLHREFRARRTARPTPLLRAIKEQVVKPLIPLTIKNRLRCLRGASQPWETDSPINMDFAHRIRLAKEMVKKGHDPFFGMTGGCRKLRLKGIRPGGSMVGCRLQQSGAGFALEIRDPTMDRRVLEFCLAIPDNQFIREGNGRFLIRRAMKGLLPEKVLLNRKRGLQAPDIAARLRQNSGQIREALTRIREESRLAAQFLDIKKMGDTLSTIEQGENLRAPRSTSTLILRGLMTGLFLCGFETGL
jgi:asparagine synthase (glutamine-hydrolysing)